MKNIDIYKIKIFFHFFQIESTDVPLYLRMSHTDYASRIEIMHKIQDNLDKKLRQRQQKLALLIRKTVVGERATEPRRSDRLKNKRTHGAKNRADHKDYYYY